MLSAAVIIAFILIACTSMDFWLLRKRLRLLEQKVAQMDAAMSALMPTFRDAEAAHRRLISNVQDLVPLIPEIRNGVKKIAAFDRTY